MISHDKVGSRAFGDMRARGEDHEWRLLHGDID